MNDTLDFGNKDFGRERFEARCRLESVGVLHSLRMFLNFLVMVGSGERGYFGV